MKYKVIIIGAGAAGLFAARTLLDRGIDSVRIITKDVGGRIVTSEDGAVNFGTFFVIPTYRHILPYVRLTRRIAKWRMGFVRDGKVVSLISIRSVRLLSQLLKLLWICIKCDRKIGQYRKKCVNASQKEIVESDPYLLKMYRTNSGDFIQQMGLQDVADTFIDQSINVIGFDDYRKSNALDLLKWLGAVYIHPFYEFQFKKQKLMRGLTERIITDEVLRIERVEDGTGYTVHTASGSHAADYVIVATEPWSARTLIPMQETKPMYSSAYGRLITGTPKGIAASRKRYLCFPQGHGIISISHMSNGTFLVYTDTAEISLDDYFDDITVLFERSWNPAFTFCSYELVESRRADRLWLACDINFAGIEDSALTGIFAAKQIVDSIHAEKQRAKN